MSLVSFIADLFIWTDVSSGLVNHYDTHLYMHRIFGPEWKHHFYINMHNTHQHATSACGMRIISIHPYNPPQHLKGKTLANTTWRGTHFAPTGKNTCLVNRQRLEGGLGAGSSRVSQVWGPGQIGGLRLGSLFVYTVIFYFLTWNITIKLTIFNFSRASYKQIQVTQPHCLICFIPLPILVKSVCLWDDGF